MAPGLRPSQREQVLLVPPIDRNQFHAPLLSANFWHHSELTKYRMILIERKYKPYFVYSLSFQVQGLQMISILKAP